MPLPFGVSVGDFIAVAALARNIIKCLNETRGAAAQLTSLINDLNSFIATINAITALLSSPNVTQGSGIDAALLNGITFHTNQCQELLQRFLSDSIDYSNALIQSQSPGKTRRIRRGIRMIRWVLFREEDARRLELRFKAHLDALEVYLVAIGIFLQQRTADEGLSRHAKLDRTADEILTLVKVDRRSYPNQLGHTWHGDNAGETIFFEDVLGRQMHLPNLFFRDLSTFQAMVEVIFRDHPGLTKILRGEYELVDEERGLLVTYGEKAPDNIIKNINRGTLSRVEAWEKKIYPGVRLRMNMIVYTKTMAPRAALLPSSRRRCPRCDVLNRGQRTVNLRTCTNCCLKFRGSFQEHRDYWNIMMKKPDHYGDKWPRLSRRVEEIDPPPVSSQFSYPGRNTSPSANIAEGIMPSGDATQSSTTSAQNIPNQPSNRRNPTLPAEDSYWLRVHCLHAFEVPCDTGHNPPSITGWQHSRNPVMHAAGQGDLVWMQSLLLEGAEINTPDYSGRCPLVYAAGSGNVDLVALLIAGGADLNASPVHVPGETALLVASEKGYLGVVKLLLERGAVVHGKPNIGPEGRKGWTALHGAVERGYVDVVRELIGRGADIDAKNEEDGKTPLRLAAGAGRQDIIDILVPKDVPQPAP